MSTSNPFVLPEQPLNPDQAGVTVPDMSTPEVRTVLSIGRISFNLQDGNRLIVAGAPVFLLVDDLLQGLGGWETLVELRPEAERRLANASEALGNDSTVSPDQMAAALGVMAALLEDVALNCHLAGREVWRSQGVLLEKYAPGHHANFVLDLIQQVQDVPGDNIELTELLYLALALGYEGPLRLDPTGPLRMTQYRENLLAFVRSNSESFPMRTSLTRARVKSVRRGLGLITPVSLVLFALMAVVVASLTTYFLFARDGSGEISLATTSLRANIPAVGSASKAFIGDINKSLAEEISQGRISITTGRNSVLFKIDTDWLFALGSQPDIPDLNRLLDKIASLSGGLHGPMHVTIQTRQGVQGRDEGWTAALAADVASQLKTRLPEGRTVLPIGLGFGERDVAIISAQVVPPRTAVGTPVSASGF